MNIKKFLVSAAAGALVLGIMAVPAFAAKGQPPIKVGPVAYADVTASDIGTCNNYWASDNYNKFYTLTLNKDGTYNLQVNDKDGTFVTMGGKSPGACKSGTDNGNTVAPGITGTFHSEYNATVTATGTPNSSPDCVANNGCQNSGNFLNAVFGAGNWSKTAWSWTGHYEAGSNGVWFDTSVNWPLNDRGDITGD